jgi:pyruvate/2-oxoglutarate dehydrogenase complex dihydrolipoamide dehydrogenase (E3) component
VIERARAVGGVCVNTGTIPSFSAPVVYRGMNYRITGIEPEGERILTLSLTND